MLLFFFSRVVVKLAAIMVPFRIFLVQLVVIPIAAALLVIYATLGNSRDLSVMLLAQVVHLELIVIQMVQLLVSLA